jgi:predicted TIM-barrel fold metal-dependent hydrolase
VDELLGLMEQARIASSLIVPWLPLQDYLAERMAAGADRDVAAAALIEQWRELNEWAVSAVTTSGGRLTCLVGLDPVAMDRPFMAEMAGQLIGAGASGLKVAPAFVLAYPDDEVMAPVWELARELGVFVLAESGAGNFKGRPAYGHPSRFEAVLRAYPEVRIMLAHLGIGAEEEVARLTGRYPNLYADISMRLAPSAWSRWSPGEAVEWMRRIGTERVVYGSNYPLVDPVGFADTFRGLELTEDEQADIAWRNAERLLAADAVGPLAGGRQER